MLQLEERHVRCAPGLSPGASSFINYVNDMPDSLESFCKIFADDTKVYTAVGDKKDHVTKRLLKLSEWS